MRTIAIDAVFAGAAVLLYSIWMYYRTLQFFRSQAHEQRLFSTWSYGAAMGLMLFFLAGYLVLGSVLMAREGLGQIDFLVAGVFFFGAVFVYMMVNAQKQMTHVINGKTDEIIRTLVNTMEAKDQYTRGHSVHVSNIVSIFYEKLPAEIKRQVNYTHLTDAAILHDIGKIGIPDYVLNKPGKLDEEEWAYIRQHPRMGKQILQHTSFKELGDIILCHHERVDQKGYYRIPAEEIPIESKIIAIADTFSALYTDRVYRPRQSFERSIAVLKECAGTQLDARMVGVFAAISEQEILQASKNLFSMEQVNGFELFTANP